MRNPVITDTRRVCSALEAHAHRGNLTIDFPQKVERELIFVRNHFFLRITLTTITGRVRITYI